MIIKQRIILFFFILLIISCSNSKGYNFVGRYIVDNDSSKIVNITYNIKTDSFKIFKEGKKGFDSTWTGIGVLSENVLSYNWKYDTKNGMGKHRISYDKKRNCLVVSKFTINGRVLGKMIWRKIEEYPNKVKKNTQKKEKKIKSKKHNRYIDRDSLGNLWIITLDKTGSMTLNEKGGKIKNLNKVLRSQELNKVLKIINFKKDSFIFYSTGILTTTDIKLLKYQKKFEYSFIHKNRNYFKIKNIIDFKTVLKEKLIEHDYIYRFSFVSLIKPFALSRTINECNVSNFNKIFIFSITDDADANDQWIADYKRVKKYGGKLHNEINDTLKNIITSPYNFRAKPTGRFFPIVESGTNQYWKILLDEYKTYYSKDSNINIDNSFIKVNQIRNSDSIFIKISKKHKYLDYIFIDSVIINSQTEIINLAFNNDTITKANFINKNGLNDIELFGFFQVSYYDQVLGKRKKKLFFSKKAQFYSNSYISNKKMRNNILLIISLLVLLTYLIWLFILRPNQVIFEVFDNKGNSYIVKRGFNQFIIYILFFIKRTNRVLSFKNGINNILMYSLNNKGFVIKMPHRYIKLKRFIEKSGKDNIRIYLKSRYELSFEIDNKSIEETKKTFKKSNYDKFISGRPNEQDLILKNIIDKEKKYKYFYYSFEVKQEVEIDIQNTRIDKQKHFNISFKEINDSYTNTRLPFETNENNFKNKKIIINHLNKNVEQNAVIIINKINNKLFWNVFIINYKGVLGKIYHVFKYVQNEEISNIQFDKTVNVLKKEAVSFLLSSDSVKVYNKIDVEFKTIDMYNLDFISSVYQSYIILQDTNLSDSIAVKKTIYSPFLKGNEEYLSISSPPKGSYNIFKSLIPIEEIKYNKNKDGKNVVNFKDIKHKLTEELIAFRNQGEENKLEFNKEKIILKNIEINY